MKSGGKYFKVGEKIILVKLRGKCTETAKIGEKFKIFSR